MKVIESKFPEKKNINICISNYKNSNKDTIN